MIVMDLSAWTTWPCGAHFPEVVTSSERKNTFSANTFDKKFNNKSSREKKNILILPNASPNFPTLNICFETHRCISSKIGHKQTIRIHTVRTGQQMPGILTGFTLKQDFQTDSDQVYPTSDVITLK